MRVTIVSLLAVPAIALAQTPQTSGTRPASVTNPDKVICKSFADVGSLIATHKECKTRAQWDAEREETQRRIGDCVNTGAATGSHCE